MSKLSRHDTFHSAPAIQWLIGLATWLAARSLNLPAPLLHSTGLLVFAHVQAIETKAARTLCPIRLLRHLRSYLR